VFREEATSVLPAMLDNLKEKLRPPLPRFMGKMVHFEFIGISLFIWGRGGYISYFILIKIVVFMRVLYPCRIGILKCWFFWRDENWRTQRKTLEARGGPITNLIHIWHWARIK